VWNPAHEWVCGVLPQTYTARKKRKGGKLGGTVREKKLKSIHAAYKKKDSPLGFNGRSISSWVAEWEKIKKKEKGK